MYKIRFTPKYERSRDKIIKNDVKLAKKLKSTLKKLSDDPRQKSLFSHKVNTVMEGVRWSSTVTGDIRLIWDYDGNDNLVIILIDIGGHSGKSRVYK